MSTFILAFGFFLTMVLAMAIGYVVQKKSISGSCGGLGALGIDKACDCPEPCDRKKARTEREEARQKRIAEWKDNQIM
ncbi:(Na+)-NQR maturation NqrM [Aestuariibacter sp. A3R04]|uniref:(Na+)-NQR maturation NqrM n=1 Tax=Aestuariibacter sp. A3R04 TaxID=2841571 RepID=UPI001C0940C0|nr:(Na+)-NQR maturation NqrM [Aestuariibacter sp. A3R04]MBU3021962.1 (Na+)-NQR maturation NqrM [Aestuariibacter sp. A3R04]